MWGVISNIRLVLGRLGSGIILNINIFRVRLEERACSTKVKLDGAKVNFREVFRSVPCESLQTQPRSCCPADQ